LPPTITSRPNQIKIIVIMSASSSSQVSWKKVHFLRLTALQAGAAAGDYLEWPCYLFDNLKELLTTVLPRDSISFWTAYEPQEESSHPLTLSPQDVHHGVFLNMAHALWIEECFATVEDSSRNDEDPIAYLFGAGLPPNCPCSFVMTPELRAQLLPFIPNVQRIVSSTSSPSCMPAIRQVMQAFQQAACPWLPPTAAAAAAAAATAALRSGNVRYAIIPPSPPASPRDRAPS
jgi:hypothetical protein